MRRGQAQGHAGAGQGPAEGRPTRSSRRSASRSTTQLRNQVLQLLISFQWIQGEAEAQGVKVTDAEVKKSFDEQKKQSFPKDADYQKFLKTSGQTEDDILQRVKLDLLSNKIRDKVVKGKDKVSDAAIADFYNKNKARFAQPEKRDLRVVLTKDKAKADAGQGGAAEPASRGRRSPRSTRSTTPRRRTAASCPAQAKGTLDKELDDARLLRQEERARRARSRPSTATTSSTVDRASPRPPSSRWPRPRTTIKQTLAVAEPAEGAGHVREGLHEALEGQDRVPRGLQDLGLQERPEGHADAAPATAARARPAGHAGRLADTCTSAPGRDSSRPRSRRLDALTRRLRRECPWDREQDERSIVPHTVGRPTSWPPPPHAATTPSCSTSSATCSSRCTSCRCCSRSAAPGSLAEVAEHVHAKLVRRHPHIFGEVEVDGSGEVLRNWDADQEAARTGREPGIFGDVPENLPGPLYARKTQRRAASTGFDFDHVPYEARARRAGGARGGARPRGALPRGRRRAVRGGQRRAQAQGRPGAGAARGAPSASAGAWRPRRSSPQPRRARMGRSGRRRPARATTPARPA